MDTILVAVPVPTATIVPFNNHYSTNSYPSSPIPSGSLSYDYNYNYANESINKMMDDKMMDNEMDYHFQTPQIISHTNFAESVRQVIQEKRKQVPINIMIDTLNFVGVNNMHFQTLAQMSNNNNPFIKLFEKILNHGITIKNIILCSKHTEYAYSDKVYTFVRSWMLQADAIFNFRKLGITISYIVSKFNGINNIVVNGKNIKDECDDALLLLTPKDSLIVTNDRLRTLKKNLDALLKIDSASISYTIHDVFNEVTVRNTIFEPDKMAIEDYATIPISDFVKDKPQYVTVLDPLDFNVKTLDLANGTYLKTTPICL